MLALLVFRGRFRANVRLNSAEESPARLLLTPIVLKGQRIQRVGTRNMEVELSMLPPGGVIRVTVLRVPPPCVGLRILVSPKPLALSAWRLQKLRL